MPAAPLPPDERRRLAALGACGVLDSGPEPGFDELTALAAELLDMPIALVSLVDAHRQWFKSRVGLDVTETSRNLSLCAHAILTPEPMVVPDAIRDPRFADNPLVTGPPGIRFYAGVPLLLSSGEALGTFCVIDLRPRQLDARATDLLARLARQAASQLELRLVNRRLEAAECSARAADAAKSAFLANMSHEIRTPMTAILGHADLLAEDGPDVDRRHLARAVASIRRNGRHLLSLINDVLDLSRIEAGRMELERVPTEPVEIVADALEMVRHVAREKGLELRATFETPVPRTIESDPTRLRQILVNLLGNAVKFTERGSVTLRASFEDGAEDAGDGRDAARGPRLRIAVADTGIGMTPEQRDRIARFDAFTQANASTSRSFGGSGLGLRITHRLAHLLGGDLDVASESGRGSTFTMTVEASSPPGTERLSPAEADAVIRRAAAGETTPERDAARGTGAVLEGLHVLLAEDAPDNQRLIRWTLERAGATVTVVGDGRQAVDRVLAAGAGDAAGDGAGASGGFDLVLLDMQMPELDGYGAARELRAAGSGIPLVAVTASAMSGDDRACLEAGCDAYAPKPINRAGLLEACRSALRAATARGAAPAAGPDPTPTVPGDPVAGDVSGDRRSAA